MLKENLCINRCKHIEEQREAARKTNELVDHLKLL